MPAYSELQTAIYRYCNYQERAHQEVRDKLYELKATTPEVEQLIAELIEKDVLNEERFARAYARGKFSIKQWGRNKIVYSLRGKRISDYCIKKALTEIDADAYWKTLQKLTEKAWQQYKTQKPEWARKSKTVNYLISRGFEQSLIHEALIELHNGG